jgi:Flp pilus assembly protein TadD
LAVSLESLAAARGAPRLSAARPPAPPARPGKDQPTPDRIAFGFIEAADGAASKGRKSEAAALLEKALAAGPGPDAARRAAAVYGGPLGEPREALRIVAPLNAGSRRAVDWLDQASWEESAGDRPAALASLSRAETCRPSPEERRRLALGFQRSGRAARSLEILKALCAEQPSRPDLLRDKGIAESLAGDQAAALADLRAAVGLDPALLSAHLSLGTLLERKGDLRGALQAFERGSAAPKAGADEEALRPLLKEGAAAAAARLRN